MNYFAKLSIYIIMFMLGLNLIHLINLYYEDGCAPEVCSEFAVSGTGRPFIDSSIEPLFNYTIVDASGTTVDANDIASVNASLQGAVNYKPAPSGITDIFGFFSWVVTGGRLIVNTLFMPIFGLPQWVVGLGFGIPMFVAGTFGTILFLIQIIGLYEFFTGRAVFR